jgi:hypothetical protein
MERQRDGLIEACILPVEADQVAGDGRRLGGWDAREGVGRLEYAAAGSRNLKRFGRGEQDKINGEYLARQLLH